MMGGNWFGWGNTQNNVTAGRFVWVCLKHPLARLVKRESMAFRRRVYSVRKGHRVELREWLRRAMWGR